MCVCVDPYDCVNKEIVKPYDVEYTRKILFFSTPALLK